MARERAREVTRGDAAEGDGDLARRVEGLRQGDDADAGRELEVDGGLEPPESFAKSERASTAGGAAAATAISGAFAA